MKRFSLAMIALLIMPLFCAEADVWRTEQAARLYTYSLTPWTAR